jgi:hypothetical protein
MEKELNIKHSETSFSRRRNYWAVTLVGILSVFFLLFWFKQGIDNVLIPMTIITIVFGGSIALRIWQNKFYLVDFFSDSDNVNIRYFNGNKGLEKNAALRDTKIVLKNTTSRSGFDCELRLKIDNTTFIVEDTFDWSLSEMKWLFEYIKHFKNEPLTDKDKFNVSRMEEKIKKNSLQ